jgi:hypothetical protein
VTKFGIVVAAFVVAADIVGCAKAVPSFVPKASPSLVDFPSNEKCP